MTNIERIRTLPTDKLAEIFYDLSNYGEYCAVPDSSCDCDRHGLCHGDCLRCCEDWLKEEADE